MRLVLAVRKGSVRVEAGVAALVLVLGSTGCEGPESGTPSDRIRPPRSSGPVNQEDVPVASCFDSAIGELAFAEEAAIVAQGFPTARGTEDTTWTPGRITDLAVGHEGFYVLDGQANEIHWIGPRLERRRRVAAEGGGPDEVRAPRALAVGPRLLWVLDARKRALLGYDRSDTVVATHDLPRPATELAVDREGRIYLTTHMLRSPDVRLPSRSREQSEEMRRRLGQTGVLVMLDPETGTIDSVSLARNREVGQRPFIEPFASNVELRGLAAGVAVVYPNANWIDIYRGDDLHEGPRSLAGCWPEELAAFYARARKQREEAARPRQRTISLVTDVTRMQSGGYLVLSSRPTDEDLYHLDSYSAVGAYLGSYVGPRRLVVPQLARLSRDASRVYGATMNGSVVRLRVDWK